MSIFTHLAISPRTNLRESSTRYAIRAGRNSPVKEFRYLRTIIVIAGVHPRFSRRLPILRSWPPSLTFGHWPGISPYTSPFGFARTCVFGKQSVDVFRCGSSPPGENQALSRSYGHCIAEFLRLVSLVHLGTLRAHPPVSVSGTGLLIISPSGFSWLRVLSPCQPCGRLAITDGFMTGGFAYLSPTCAQRHSHMTWEIPRSVPASVINRVQEY